MGKVTAGAVAVAAVATAQKVAKKVRPGEGGTRHGDPERWHAVTVNLPPGKVSPDGVAPVPLRDLPGVEVEMRPAPGDRGTEIAVRGGKNTDVGELRRALREAKQLLETGEVLKPAGPPTTRPTLLNKPLREATEHGRDGGRL